MSLPSIAKHDRRIADGRAVGGHDLLACHVIRDALAAAQDGSYDALVWLQDGSRPFGGRYWAESLGAGPQVAEALERL